MTQHAAVDAKTQFIGRLAAEKGILAPGQVQICLQKLHVALQAGHSVTIIDVIRADALLPEPTIQQLAQKAEELWGQELQARLGLGPSPSQEMAGFQTQAGAPQPALPPPPPPLRHGPGTGSGSGSGSGSSGAIPAGGSVTDPRAFAPTAPEMPAPGIASTPASPAPAPRVGSQRARRPSARVAKQKAAPAPAPTAPPASPPSPAPSAAATDAADAAAERTGLEDNYFSISKGKFWALAAGGFLAPAVIITLWLVTSLSASSAETAAAQQARESLITVLAHGPDRPLPHELHLLADVVAVRGSAERDVLRTLLADGPPAVRMNAARLLGLLRDPDADGGLLVLAASDDGALVQLVVDHARARIKGERLPEKRLADALESDSTAVRVYAVQAAAAEPTAARQEWLAELIDHPDPPTRVAVLGALAGLEASVLDELGRGRAPTEIAMATGGGDPRPGPGTRPIDPVTPTGGGTDEPSSGAGGVNIDLGGDVDGGSAATPTGGGSGDAGGTPAAGTEKPPAGAGTEKPPAAGTEKPPAGETEKPPPDPTPPKPAGPTKKERAIALMAKGNPHRAVDLLSEAILKNNQNGELYQLRGRARLAIGSLTDAEADLGKAIQLAPEHSAAYYDLGVLFASQKKTKQAIDAIFIALMFGFRDIEEIRGEMRLEKLKGSKRFRFFMERFFFSPDAADPDDDKRFKTAMRRLRAAFKNERDPYLRAKAVLEFPEAGGLEATEYLHELLRDKAVIVQRSIAEVLAKTRDPQSIAFLIDKSETKSPASRRVAILWALRDIPGGKVVEPMLTAIEDGSEEVQLAAAEGLGDHPDRRAIKPLIRLLGQVHPRERVVVAEALGKISGEDLGLEPVDWNNWFGAHGQSVEIGEVKDPCVQEESVHGGTIAPSAYSHRFGSSKVEALRRFGGTPIGEKAVSAGLTWLSKHQAEDGRWDADRWTMSCPEREPWQKPPGPRERRWDVQVTGAALLAFLGTGHTHLDGEFAGTVGKGLDFLLKSQRSDGYIQGDHTNDGSSHATAAAALCEAYLLTRDCRMRRAGQRAIDWIVKTQFDNGGWGWHKEESRVHQTSWSVLALVTAYDAGLRVPASTFVRARTFIDRVTLDQNEGTLRPGYAYELLSPAVKVGEGLRITTYDDRRSGGGVVTTAKALWCRLVLGETVSKDPRIEGAIAQFASTTPRANATGVINSDYTFFASMCALRAGGSFWKRWNAELQKTFTEAIVQKTCERGSWEPGDTHGRVHSTSVAVLNLETYYRFHGLEGK